MIIVEVAMEIAHASETLQKIFEKRGASLARACAMSNSVGGIGPLLKERIAAQSELGIEVIGVSLLYEYVWVQGFYQWGQIFIEKQKVGPYIREALEDCGIRFNLELADGSQCAVKVWKAPYGKASVYFLDAPEIANVVYPGPEDAPDEISDGQNWVEMQKLKQSWLVGRGTLSLLKILNQRPNFIVQSETPAFFANHSLSMDPFQKDPFFEGVRYIFNDHTPLEYAHPVWDETQIQRARIDPRYAQEKKYWNQERKGIDVTRLLVGVSHGVYGVSKKHAQVMKAMPSLNGFNEKIRAITNGVSVQDWQHPDYKNFAELSDQRLVDLKEARKSELIEWVWRRYRLWVDWRGKVKGKCFVLWTRRVTSYKRFDVLERLLKDPNLKTRFLQTEVVVLVGGRIHQNDDLSQNVMFHLLDLVTRDPDLKDRVVILDNYNVWDAHKLFSGIDATIMLADDGREASATGFMKAQVNGAIVIASNDGAIPESVYFHPAGKEQFEDVENGFEVPYVNGEPQPEGLMSAFEQLDHAYKNSKIRGGMMRAALRVSEKVSVDRTAREMTEFYESLSPNKLKR